MFVLLLLLLLLLLLVLVLVLLVILVLVLVLVRVLVLVVLLILMLNGASTRGIAPHCARIVTLSRHDGALAVTQRLRFASRALRPGIASLALRFLR